MSFEQIQPYIIPALLFGYIGWRYFRFRGVRSQIPKLVDQGGVIVDVRSPGEYQSGASLNSVNIPLDRLEKEVGRLDKEKPVILCCASGTRSAMAARLLKKHGFRNVLNAGPWRNTLIPG